MNLLRRLDQEQCLRCGKAGHSSEDCPNGMPRILVSFFALILRTTAILAIFFFLVGTLDYCAETYANDVPTYGRPAWNKN
ncbi:hypothetical protein PIN31009_01869 [Pandoraea iniqua]|uniref:C2HC-type zinc finger protein n=1 Tax=Pandoraea iniqua TaxID=2508288 RepID=UPI0012412FA5|nr:C2HC-type zinc finger protein [Pandoraea iniqua]VVD95822.1 hypothetical protein PIN31009_01869 [Pandoraea iniqua]